MPKHAHSGRRRFTWGAAAAGAGGSLFLALSMGASLSGFVGVITNSNNTAATAALAIQETGTTNATGTCYTYDATTNCSSINKYGGTGTPLVPGGTQSTAVTFTNTGSAAVATSNVKADACVAVKAAGVTGASTPTSPNTSAGNLCSVLNLTVYKGATSTTPIFTGSLASFGSTTTTTPIQLQTLAIGASQVYNFVLNYPSGADVNTQGQQVSQNITWTFNQ